MKYRIKFLSGIYRKKENDYFESEVELEPITEPTEQKDETYYTCPGCGESYKDVVVCSCKPKEHTEPNMTKLAVDLTTEVAKEMLEPTNTECDGKLDNGDVKAEFFLDEKRDGKIKKGNRK